MRILDISTAALAGLVTMAAIFAWSPAPYETAAHRYVVEMALRGILANVIMEKGLAWLQESSLASICGALASYSNATVTISAAIGSSDCFAGPPLGSVSSTFVLPLSTGQVTLEAWESTGP